MGEIELSAETIAFHAAQKPKPGQTTPISSVHGYVISDSQDIQGVGVAEMFGV